MKIQKYISLIFLAMLACKGKDDDDNIKVVEGEIFINEISSVADDWVELYNSSDKPIDVGGYLIYDDPAEKYTIPANTNIDGKGFLVLYCDGTNTGLHTNFKLASGGETVYLENKDKKVTNLVKFPALGAGQTYARFPDGSETFTITGSATPGKTNGTSSAPVIANISHTPLVPSPSSEVKVTAEVQDDTAAPTVKLFYSVNKAAFTSKDMIFNNGKYEAMIPKLDGAGEVQYYIEAKDKDGATTLNPLDAPTTVFSYLITTDALPSLVINEFLSTNLSCCPDPNGEYDDWIEIYNKGTAAINIAGMYISDDRTNPFKFKISNADAAKTTIQPGGYLVLWADEQTDQGPLHINIKLAATGEDVGLYYIDGRTIDEYTFGAQSPDVSSGRSPNGEATWKTFSIPTPGSANP